MLAEKKVACWDHVKHLIKRGELILLHFDTETYGVARTAPLTSAGASRFDIAGNYIDTKDIEMRWDGRDIPELPALLVTDTKFADLMSKHRVPLRHGMCMVAQWFEQGHRVVEQLGLASRYADLSYVRKEGADLYKSARRELVIDYPLVDREGKAIQAARYHPAHDTVAYRVDDDPASPFYEYVDNNYYLDPDGAKWRSVPARIAPHGHRIKWADLVWMRYNLVRAGFPTADSFLAQSRATITSKQRPKPIPVDDYNTERLVSVFGPQGEAGFKLGTKFNNERQRNVPSAALGAIAEANSGPASPERGIPKGFRLADGSVFTEARTHNSVGYDTLVNGSLAVRAREIAPDIVAQAEKQADDVYLRHFLKSLEAERPPIFVMVRDMFPLTDPVDLVTFLNFDDQLGRSGKALMVRLDRDLRELRYNGKKLTEMSAHDFADWIRHERHKPEALVRVEPVNRWSGALRLDDYIASGNATGIDYAALHTADSNFSFLLENPSLQESLAAGVEIALGDSLSRPEAENSTFEEESTHHGFGDIDYFEKRAANEEKMHRRQPGVERGAAGGLFTMLHARALDIYNHANGLDTMLKRLGVKAHPVDYSDAPEDLENFRDLMRNARRYFRQKHSPFQHIFDGVKIDAIGLETARTFRWNLMKRSLADYMKELDDPRSRFRDGIYDQRSLTQEKSRRIRDTRLIFGDLSRKIRLADEHDHELTLDYLQRHHAMNPKEVQDRFKDGRWRIQFHRQRSNPSVSQTLLQFEMMDRVNELPAQWQFASAAGRRRAYWGPLHEDAGRMRTPGRAQVEQQILAIEVNARERNAEGLARIFDPYRKGQAEILADNDRAHEIISDYKFQLKKLDRQLKLTDDFKRSMNYDPETNLNYDWIPRLADRSKTIFIDVPDPHLRAPYDRDLRLSPLALIVPRLDAETKKKICDGAPLILRGKKSGRLYHPGPVELHRPPREERGFQDFFADARRAYADGGVEFPERMDVLLVEPLKPIARSRPEYNDRLPAAKLPPRLFEGLVSRRLAHMDRRVTSLLVPKDLCGFAAKTGKPMRFREMQAADDALLHGADGPSSGHTYETQRVTHVRTIKADAIAVLPNETAQACGYASAHDAWDKVRRAMLKQERADPDVDMLLIEFEPVKPSSWAYFNPPQAPEAAFYYNSDRNVPPSAYRPKQDKRFISMV